MSDPTTPTPDEIARWAALAEQATAGPWVAIADYYDGPLWQVRQQARVDEAELPIADFWDHRTNRQSWDTQEADAAFIAAARTAVPRLLALVAAQQDQLAELKRIAAERQP